uniref:HAD family hydrolase n=1 Tax=Archaeoglobus fulgidus TaxID=2234 RepID=A0A7J2THT5_ARCFL
MEGKEGYSVFNGNSKDSEKIVFTDYEGPWVLNDFAYELCTSIFNDDRFFRNLSEFDDYLYYSAKKEGYEAGYTLKLIVPFISAFGKLEIAEKLVDSVVFVPKAKEAAERILKLCRVVVISTAPRIFVERTAKIIGFKEIHASELEFLELDENTKAELLGKVDILASLSGEELYKALEDVFSRFWDKIEGIRVIGAREKAEILESYSPKSPIAIGDSITDCKMFEKARELKGVAIAFNGNRYAIERADFAIVSRTALAEAIAVEKILKGREPKIGPRFGKIFRVTESNMEKIIRESMKMRVKLRGLAGSLG